MQTVKVRLRKPYRVFTFLCRNIPLKRNDACIVRSDRGLEYGTCVVAPEECSKEVEERHKMTVVRLATCHDNNTYQEIREEEARAHELCASKIRERRLRMKLVEVEYTFDRRKVVFYFTAEERVDFRELVRDLAHELKTRIELRHIQVRDEAKMVGGIGTCGRELCCSSWLQEFVPISMKMAKRQNLSLNPGKISGQCGRLMCCLSYENSLYTKEKKSRAAVPEKEEKERLAALRDDMEADAPAAAGILAKTTLSDVTPEGGGESSPGPPDASSAPTQIGPPAHPGSVEATAAETAPTQPPGEEAADQPAREAGAKGGEPGTADKAQTRPKRRRRRRRRSPKGQNGGTGGGSGASS